MRNWFHLNKKYILCLVFFLVLFAVFPLSSAVASGLSYYDYNTGSDKQYDGRQVTYIYNNRTLNLEYPGIIINDIALADAEALFGEQLGLAVSYNKSLNQIAISDGKNTILMEPGSKTAYVNGVMQTMSEAPVRLRFSGSNRDKLYVPTRFACQNLGYTYLWTSSTNTVKITKTLKLSINSKEVNYIGTLYSINYMNQAVDFGQMPILVYNGALLVRAQKLCEVADCKFTQVEDEISITKGNITILFTLNQNIAYVNGKKIDMQTSVPYNITNLDSGITYVYIPLDIFAEYLGFDLQYNDTHKQYTLLESERTGKPEKIEALQNYDEYEYNAGGQTNVSVTDVYFSWKCLNEYEAMLENKSNAIHNIYTGTSSEAPGTVYLLYNQASDTDNVETFRFGTTDSFQSIDTKKTENGLRVIISHAETATNGQIPLDYAIVEKYLISGDSENTQVILDFIFRQGIDAYEYSIELSDDGRELCVSVFPKYLTKVVAYPSGYSDVLELHGVQRADITVFDDQGFLFFELPATYNCVGTQYYSNETGAYLNYCLLKEVAGKTKLQIRLAEDTAYHLVEKDDAVYVYFTDEDITMDELFNLIESPSVELPEDKLIIPLPSGCSVANITDQDDYLDKKFKIMIKGDQRSLINTKGISNPYSMIKNYVISYDDTTNYTTVTFETSNVCGYKYDIFENYLIVTVGKPSDIFSKIVVLDPGHGGIDPGANYNNVYEKTLNYKILYTYAKDYFADSDIKVYYTRETDVLIDLYKRAEFAAEVEADLFVSLHMNANTSSSAKGTQVFYSTSNNTKQSNGLTSQAMAQLFANNLSTVMNTKNRGVGSAEYVVVKYNTVPAILIELGFMSNSSDFSKLTDATYQKKAAKEIYETIEEIFATYPTGR